MTSIRPATGRPVARPEERTTVKRSLARLGRQAGGRPPDPSARTTRIFEPRGIGHILRSLVALDVDAAPHPRGVAGGVLRNEVHLVLPILLHAHHSGEGSVVVH